MFRGLSASLNLGRTSGRPITIRTGFDNNGDLDRESFLVKVEKGKQVVTATLPPVNPIQ